MPLHALFQQVQPARLADAQKGVHLALQGAQLTQHLCFKVRHTHLHSVYRARRYEPSGRLVNTTLDTAEYLAGVEPSYIRT